MSSPFKVVSLFAGCGGSSTGYVMAGGKVVLAVEWDDNAVATYRANWPDTPVYHGDVHALTVEKILDITGLEPGELDILDGSPPCQGFSTAGKREYCDPRNQLYNEYIRILCGLKPKAFIMENVSGMVKGKMKLIFADILRELKASGYRVKARLMNAMYYGVPQSRQRMIFIGVREDLGIEPSHPKPQTAPIPANTIIQGLIGTRSQQINPWIPGENPAATLCKSPRGYEIYGTFTSGFNKGERVDFRKPFPTLMKDGLAGSSHSQFRIVDGATIRKMTIPEAKRIASYPDDYVFLGKFEEQWARIGNSVPPLLMKAIAEHVRRTVLET